MVSLVMPCYHIGIQLVKVRAAAMQMASDKISSRLLKLTGLDNEQAEDVCSVVQQEGYGDCSITNKLYPRALIIGSSTQAIDFVSDCVQERGGSVEVLPLSGAFHSSFMLPAIEQFAEAVNKAPLQLPNLPVYSNVTCRPYSSVEEIRTLLVKQLTNCIAWDSVIENMMKDYPQCSFVECGPGRQLNFILKKLNKQAKCVNFIA